MRPVVDSRRLIAKVTGPVSSRVGLGGDQIVRRHQNHMRKKLTESEELPVPSLDASPELNTTPRTEPETESNSENKSISI